jgi:hypothetical protein
MPAKRKAALVRQPQVREVQAQVVPELERRIGSDDEMLGELGLVELKLTEKEEAILAEPVDPAKVRIRPDGVVYLPHIEYTRWFNRAFGRCAWTIAPIGKAQLANNSVVVPYVLFVHRQPVATAKGEQDFFASNRGQTYGDALESTVASGLRRCAKRLGVGLELWDGEWTRTWQATHAIPVKVRKKKRDGEGYYMATEWRRPQDPPLPFEKGTGRVEDDYQGEGSADWVRGPSEPERPRQAPPKREAPRPAPDAGTHAQAGEAITAPQRARLNTLIYNSGRDEQAVLAWLRARCRRAARDPLPLRRRRALLHRARHRLRVPARDRHADAHRLDRR